MCKYVLSKKGAERHAICVSNTRKYVYMHELSREGRAGRRGLGGGAVGTAFKEVHFPKGILRNGEFSEIQRVRWSGEDEVSRYPILFPLCFREIAIAA